MSKFDWFYDEVRQVGTDFTNMEQVKKYDSNMSDRSGEVKKLISVLKLDGSQTVLEIGTGTGSIAVGLASACKHFYAIDVSKTMLEYASEKARLHEVDNITFNHGGFLTYQHIKEPIHRIISHFALHHLPDFWKSIAIQRMYDQLEVGGVLYLQDVVYSFPVRNYEESIDSWIEDMTRNGSSFQEAEWCAHVRDEYSTFGWILEGMLRNSGFLLMSAEYSGNTYATYMCKKEN
ncbi:ubiquinone/menaquinone biosynthesis C-methylase UbiE [Paenibacillus rhizosphaerae]|uniref:Ubiquinone/menaquinone biosynthesis C-methylase UbiE n=1 Tax=Paenibacillus rhizosphaerae TaxID=297318 RepID=A0A839TSM5_9BACL|nr:class I SAM-dependent methyltransferase [Paenibacillus rhizosphaerae]MBB3128660.1 ubiquinone/menaquinone biosynthesis C-methylase UbiE [Paenibacillus rhizosphaerae]